jgi:hypothetical protein
VLDIFAPPREEYRQAGTGLGVPHLPLTPGAPRGR